jgi:putative heme transporter
MTAPNSGAHAVRGRPLVRYLVGLALGVVVLVLLLSREGELHGATSRLAHLSWWWAVGALGAEVASLACYALLQRVVLSAAGVRVGVGALFALTLANNSIALSVPGEPVFSSAFRYRQYRRRGASGAGAGWTILTLIVAQAIGMSLIILIGLGASLAGGGQGPKVGVAIVALVVVVGAGVVFLRRGLLVGVVGAVVRAARRVTGHPRGDLQRRVEQVLEDVRVIQMRGPGRVATVALALGAWVADCACLIAALRAVHAQIPWHGVLLAFGAAQIVAVVPISPGGLGLVEGSLAVVLVAYGMGRVPALSGVLLYRIISFWLAVGVGWVAFGWITLWVNRRQDRAGSPAEESPAPAEER